MRYNNLTGQKGVLLVDEFFTPHQLEGIWLMRLFYLIKQKEILPVMWERLLNPLKHQGWFWEPAPKKFRKIYNINGWKITPRRLLTAVFGSC
jgi:hypothetical protein